MKDPIVFGVAAVLYSVAFSITGFTISGVISALRMSPQLRKEIKVEEIRCR